MIEPTHLEYELAKSMFFKAWEKSFVYANAERRERIFQESAERDNWLKMGRIAVAALPSVLSEPTPAMLDAGFKVLKVVGADDVLKRVWAEMTSALAREKIKIAAPEQSA